MKRATLPKNQRDGIINLAPAKPAVARTIDTDISTATNITLNEETTYLHISATNGSVYLKYSADCSAETCDEFVQEGQTIDRIPTSDITVISVLEASSGAGVVLIEK